MSDSIPLRAPGEHCDTGRGSIDTWDRKIIMATQAGLLLTPRPYHAIAEQVGLSAEEVMSRMRDMVRAGIIRRIGAVPNH
jgi:DNA-binding Lrp family transcriptional regulator